MPDFPPRVTKLADESLSAVHQTLRVARRRLAIALVLNHAMTNGAPPNQFEEIPPDILSQEPVVTVRQLSREIVAIEDDIPLEHATGDKYHSVYTSLCQTHLPRLDNVGAITYNDNRKTVRPNQNLMPMAAAAALTSPIAQHLLHDAIADLFTAGRVSTSGSITD